MSRVVAAHAGSNRIARRVAFVGLSCALLIACVSRTRHESGASAEGSGKAQREAPSSPARNSLIGHKEASALGIADRRQLMRLARASLTEAVQHGKRLPTPEGLAPALVERKGSFVTLTIQGELRGCIGNILPDKPLAEAVIQNARNAALSDPRFSPVTPAELGSIEVEVSVLTVPAPLRFTSAENLLRKLRPHTDGVVLSLGGHRATFLPQVWEQLPEPTDFLEHLAAKAGLERSAWREQGLRIETYQVEAFKESEPGLK